MISRKNLHNIINKQLDAKYSTAKDNTQRTKNNSYKYQRLLKYTHPVENLKQKYPNKQRTTRKLLRKKIK